MVDLKLLLPSYMLENSRIKEFVEVVEEVISDVVSNIKDVNKLNQLGVLDEVIDRYLEEGFICNFGLPGSFFELDNKSIYAFVIDWLRTKGTTIFARKLGFQLGTVVEVKDLSQQCLVWSRDSGWSTKVFQDGYYNREGSVLYQTLIPFGEEISEFVPVGVYWWTILTFISLVLSYFLLRFSYCFCFTVRKEVECHLNTFFFSGLYVPKVFNLLLHSKITPYGMVINQNMIPLPIS